MCLRRQKQCWKTEKKKIIIIIILLRQNKRYQVLSLLCHRSDTTAHCVPQIPFLSASFLHPQFFKPTGRAMQNLTHTTAPSGFFSLSTLPLISSLYQFSSKITKPNASIILHFFFKVPRSLNPSTFRRKITHNQS